MALGILLALSPLMTYMWYDWSLGFIKSLQPLHSEGLTKLMNIFSQLGDGEVFVYVNLVFFVTGDQRGFLFNGITLTLTTNLNNWFKLFLRGSRPQFDDLSLGVVSGGHFCAGEFGNPSGHALLGFEYPLTFYFYFRTQNADWFRRNPIKHVIIVVVMCLYIAGVCACRIYLGRHALDQIVLGMLLGLLATHFHFYCFKPFMFEPVFFAVKNEDARVSVERSYRAMVFSFLFFCFILS